MHYPFITAHAFLPVHAAAEQSKARKPLLNVPRQQRLARLLPLAVNRVSGKEVNSNCLDLYPNLIQLCMELLLLYIFPPWIPPKHRQRLSPFDNIVLVATQRLSPVAASTILCLVSLKRLRR